MTDLPARVVRRGGRLLGLFVGLVLVFVLAMTAVYALPQGRIVKNLRASMSTLYALGQRTYPLGGNDAFQLDTTTDALMLDTSIVTRSSNPLLNAMANDHGLAGGIQKGAGGEQSGRLPWAVNTITALAASVAGHRGPVWPYAYYWHGYQVVLRPALLCFTYADIRWLNMLGLALLALIVVITMHRIAGWEAAAAFFFSLALTGSFVVPMSLALSPDFYVMLAAVLAVLLLAKGNGFRRVDMEVFLVAGMLCAFFGFLITPLLTLGMPLVVVFIMRGRNGRTQTFVRNVALVLKLSTIWALGYLGAWIAKWYIGSAIVHINVVRFAATEFLYRVGASRGPGPLEGLRSNLVDLVMVLMTQHPRRHIVLAIPVLVLVAIAIWLLVRFRRPHDAVICVLPALLVVPLPYLWFVVASQLSARFAWAAYRVQAMVIFAILYAVLASIDWEDVIATVGKLGAGYRSGRPGG